jgi:glutamate--cysteine ligase
MVDPVSTVMPTEGEDDPGEPLEGTDALLAYFASGEKTRDAFRIGTEHEKFGFTRADREPLQFDGDHGIHAILDEIARESQHFEHPYQRVQEDGNTIALFAGKASITLEPGGQLELSGAPLKYIRETCREVGEHLDLLKAACIPRGVGFIGIGFHPTATWAEMASVPKQRYGIMERYMPKVGSRGLDMMKRTATVQANFDYESEADMVASFQTALMVSPLVTALFANSTFVEGKPTGWVSERARVWGDTDPDRSGFPQLILDDGFGYEAWMNYVLDAPMYFVRRDGQHHDYAGASFREFMGPGLDGHRATMRDFQDHLTTVFPEVRLKTYLEVRGADCGPWSRICALPALWKGLLYDPQARDAARALMETPTANELRVLHQDVARRGLDAEHRGHSVHALCAKLVDFAHGGLARLRDDDSGDESTFLRPIVEVVERKETFGEWLVRKYEGEWARDLTRIYDEIEFWGHPDLSGEGSPVS